MKFDTLAADYDGTLADGGVVDLATLEALRRARAGGLRLLLVTGRELNDLLDTFAQHELFDWIVAENGGVLYDPTNGTFRLLGSPPPSELIDALTRDNVPISIGHSIVATGEPYRHQLLARIQQLDLDWHVVFNRGSAMALPSGVTKASGLAAALAAMHVPPTRVVGVGDAENDRAFLRTCGLAVAVANALPPVKAMTDVVTRGAYGAGVSELIDRLLAGDISI